MEWDVMMITTRMSQAGVDHLATIEYPVIASGGHQGAGNWDSNPM